MNADVTAALNVAKKLMTSGRTPRLTFTEKLLAGAVLQAVARQAAGTPSTPLRKALAWEQIETVLEVYLENVPGGTS